MKAENKKVLIITYYWPPAGGPGVQRWLKFAKYLPEYGIQPIVYIPENPTYPIVDVNLVKEVSDKVIVLKRPIFEPYQLASFLSKNKTKKMNSGIIPNKKKQQFLDKVLLWIRGNLFIPDARCFWVKPSISYLEKYIVDNKIDTIITSGPPHSLHLIGLGLKKKLDLKWFADFRDPWTTIGYHKTLRLSRFAEKKHKKLERQVLNTADTIIVTSATTKVEFQALTTKPISVITNGYDVESVDVQALDVKFSLAHIGSFLSDRNPLALWESLAELINELPSFKSDLEIKLIGAVSQEVLDTINRFELVAYTNNMGYVSHAEAIAHQRKSQVLLLIEIDSVDTKSIIPGKLFEYMVSNRPIIGIGPKDSDFAEIIKTTNTGVFFEYEEKERLKSVILTFYNQFLNGTLQSNGLGLQKYSRKNLTKELVDLLIK
ncbi:glycosyltransferase family 4 protein [Flavobacterium sp. F-380]|uniref:Glycosyltransferase family 4 protein n=1 Tax=Flavobacterium kayseriense TaxID=2764714 RepID=A0ABR7J686_9FLAO|nr:glycosyltransferase family 4 protein [Flavobacterium kayseriense]MBC5841049.1 glycosyltransferase family 4 protein [Flavobacterium kayseriense]MBC5847577.1 glycosyltransferase family 4 protein [Flavobacterium kayseriense]